MLEGTSEAEKQLRILASFGIDLDEIAEKLQLDGIAAFASAYDRVIATLEKKSKTIAIAASK